MRKNKLYKVTNFYLPVLLEQTFSTVSTMLGTILVSSVGTNASAGVGMVDQLNFLFMNILTCIATGITAVISQCVGRGDIKKAQASASHSISVSIYGSVIISLFLIIFKEQILNMLFGQADPAVLSSASTYLFYTSISLPILAIFNVFIGIRRAVGDNLTPLLGAFLSNIFYISISIFCMKVLNLGISSVGFGLLFSRLLSSIVLGYFVYKRPRLLKIPKFTPKIKYSVLKPVLDIAIPNSIDGMIFNGGKLLVQVFVSGLGTLALAANTISLSIIGFVQLPSKTFQVTSVPVTGRAYGSGDMKETKKVILMQMVAGNISQLVMNIIYYIFFTRTYLLYTQDPEIIGYVDNLVKSFLIMSPMFFSASFMVPSALRATGDSKFTMRISVISLFVFRVFGSWFFGIYMGYGIYGIWAGMYIDWVVRTIFYISRVFSKKWHTKEKIMIGENNGKD